VLYSLSGSCAARASQYSCRISVTTSNGLVAAGYVSVFPTSNHSEECRSSEPLVHNSVNLDGVCTFPYATKILAIYSLNTDPTASRLAAAYIHWG
jgi:hypothetical protein